MNKTVSVIIPVYNVSNYLPRCIESVISQTYRDLEIILVDDGSTDESSVICHNYALEDKRVRYIRQDNSGVSAARNNGLNVCTGNYISFVDSDDWLEPDMYLEMVNAIEITGTDFSVCRHNRVVEDNGNYIKKHVSYFENVNSNKTVFGYEMFNEIYAYSVTLWNKLFKRDILKDIKFKEEVSYGEDCEYFFEVLETARSAVIIPYYGYNYLTNRSGNAVKAPINDSKIHYLDFNKKQYDTLKSYGCSNVGIYRLTMVSYSLYKQALLLDSELSKVYKEQCVSAVRKPNLTDVIHFLLDNHYSIKSKMIFLDLSTFRFNPKLHK